MDSDSVYVHLNQLNPHKSNMKKIYTILALGFLFLQGGFGFSQSAFQFLTPDTLVYGDTVSGGDLGCHNNFIINKTGSPVTVYVVRVQDVSVVSGWASYMCTDGQCFPPNVDSVSITLAANDSTEFIPHFGITATADSQTILMSVRNANNLSDVAYQRFHGVTKIGYLGMYEYADLASVNVYPSPVVSGSNFNLNISNVKTKSNNFSLVVYTFYGSVVKSVNDLQEGNNTLSLDLASGLYSYSLSAGDVLINSGNFSVIK